MSNKELKAISVFSGAMGLDLGMEHAGFKIKACVELDKHACETIRLNRPEIQLHEGDVAEISGNELLKLAGIKKGELTLLFGGPPCQSFSTAGKRKSLNDIKGNCLLEFIRLIEEMRPEYFVFENVKGLLSAALNHRPISERGKNFPPLEDDEKPGSVVKLILRKLSSIGYKTSFKLLNSADYGVPQKRERVFFVGSRDGYAIPIPDPTHSNLIADNKLRWVTFGDVMDSLSDVKHTYSKYSADRLKYMKMIPRGGGNWRDLPDDIAKVAMGGAYKSGGGKVGYFRRLHIDRPSPTLVTSPHQKSTNLGHPNEDRPLSIEEYKAIQQFPLTWTLSGPLSAQYRQMGNAVPVGLGHSIGEAIFDHISNVKGVKHLNPLEYNIVSEELKSFYDTRISKLLDKDIFQILKRKNPYLYRAFGTNDAHEFIREILLDSQTSSDETLFGSFFESTAIRLAENGQKSTTDSVDMEVRHPNDSIDLVAIKSGPHVFNSQSARKQREAFEAAQRRLRTHAVRPIIGYCYGRKKQRVDSNKNHDVLAGQAFWAYVTGNENFYIDLIHMVGRAAEEHKQHFEDAWNQCLNKQYMRFMKVFCNDTGNIEWTSVVQYNSAEEVPQEIKDRIKSAVKQSDSVNEVSN